MAELKWHERLFKQGGARDHLAFTNIDIRYNVNRLKFSNITKRYAKVFKKSPGKPNPRKIIASALQEYMSRYGKKLARVGLDWTFLELYRFNIRQDCAAINTPSYSHVRECGVPPDFAKQRDEVRISFFED